MTFFLFIVRLVEVQYKAAPGVLHSLKKVKKPKKWPEGRNEKAVQEERLLSALRSHITSKATDFDFERTEEQKERFKGLKKVFILNYCLLLTFNFRILGLDPSTLAFQSK